MDASGRAAADTALARGVAALRAGRAREALEALLEARTAQPGVAARVWRSRAAMAAGDAALARREVAAALLLDPLSASAHEAMAAPERARAAAATSRREAVAAAAMAREAVDKGRRLRGSASFSGDTVWRPRAADGGALLPAVANAVWLRPEAAAALPWREGAADPRRALLATGGTRRARQVWDAAAGAEPWPGESTGVDAERASFGYQCARQHGVGLFAFFHGGDVVETVSGRRVPLEPPAEKLYDYSVSRDRRLVAFTSRNAVIIYSVPAAGGASCREVARYEPPEAMNEPVRPAPERPAFLLGIPEPESPPSFCVSASWSPRSDRLAVITSPVAHAGMEQLVHVAVLSVSRVGGGVSVDVSSRATIDTGAVPGVGVRMFPRQLEWGVRGHGAARREVLLMMGVKDYTARWSFAVAIDPDACERVEAWAAGVVAPDLSTGDMVVSPDGRVAAAVKGCGAVMFLGVGNGGRRVRPDVPLPAGCSFVVSLSWSPCGTFLLVNALFRAFEGYPRRALPELYIVEESNDSEARVWVCDPFSESDEACAAAEAALRRAGMSRDERSVVAQYLSRERAPALPGGKYALVRP